MFTRYGTVVPRKRRKNRKTQRRASDRALRGEQLEARRLLAVLTDTMLVGGVTADAARVQLRSDVSANVQVEYSTSPTFSSSSTSASQTTMAGGDFTAILDLDSLAPATEYYYRAVIDGVPVIDGVTRSFETFVTAGATSEFSFAITADSKNINTNPTVAAPAFAALAGHDPSFVMQIGDFDHRNPGSLTGLRNMHRQVRDPTKAAGKDFSDHIATQFPFVHVWDDHDLGVNNADKNFAGIPDALQAFDEYYPTVDRPNAAGIWHSFQNGIAEFFMLDARTQRDPASDPDGLDKSMLDGNEIANGQVDWLQNGLLNSTATWKIIASSVPFNATAKPTEGWGAYPDERQDILDFINTNAITNVVVVSGDLHSGGAIDDGTNAGLPELSVPHTNLNTNQATSGPAGVWSEGLVSGVGGEGFGFITVRQDEIVLETWSENDTLRSSLTIAAEGVLSDTQGPATGSVMVTPSAATAGPLAIAASIDDLATGGSNIAAAEFFVDAVGGVGTGAAVTASDGNFDSPTEAVNGTIDSTAFDALGIGVHTLFVRGQDDAGNWGAIDSTTFEKQAGGGQVLFRVNAGGPEIADTPLWTEDTDANPSQYVSPVNSSTESIATAIDMSDSSIPAGTPMALFQSNRVDLDGGGEMQWDFPVTPGNFEVRLYFAETWSGGQAPNIREFDVNIEGLTVLDNLDIFEEVGGFAGLVKSFVVSSDSNLDIDFSRVVQNPLVHAIEILSTNSSPVTSLPGPQATVEETAVVFTGANAISIDDPDGDDPLVTLSASDGVVTLGDPNRVTIVGGANGSSMIMFTGALADVNAALDGTAYWPDLDFSGPASLRIQTEDGNGGMDDDILAIIVDPLNDDPANLGGLPADVTVAEDVAGAVDLSLIDLDDVDALGASLAVTLSTNSGGLLTAIGSGGVTVGGSDTGVLTLEGVLAELNAFLDVASNITYQHGVPHTAGNAADTIQVDVSDMGNTGAGGGDVVNLGLVNVNITPDNSADFDLNNRVDGADFLLWQRGYGVTTGATLADGDANSDQAVDAVDLGYWQDQYGQITTPLSAAASGPPTVGLLGVGSDAEALITIDPGIWQTQFGQTFAASAAAPAAAAPRILASGPALPWLRLTAFTLWGSPVGQAHGAGGSIGVREMVFDEDLLAIGAAAEGQVQHDRPAEAGQLDQAIDQLFGDSPGVDSESGPTDGDIGLGDLSVRFATV